MDTRSVYRAPPPGATAKGTTSKLRRVTTQCSNKALPLEDRRTIAEAGQEHDGATGAFGSQRCETNALHGRFCAPRIGAAGVAPEQQSEHQHDAQARQRYEARHVLGYLTTVQILWWRSPKSATF
jgi:hypothetical protein